jgi:hypothetical protein
MVRGPWPLTLVVWGATALLMDELPRNYLPRDSVKNAGRHPRLAKLCTVTGENEEAPRSALPGTNAAVPRGADGERDGRAEARSR